MRTNSKALRRTALLTSLTSLTISGIGFTPVAFATPTDIDSSASLTSLTSLDNIEPPVETTPPPVVRSGRGEPLADSPVIDPAPPTEEPPVNPDPANPDPLDPDPVDPDPLDSVNTPTSIRSGRDVDPSASIPAPGPTPGPTPGRGKTKTTTSGSSSSGSGRSGSTTPDSNSSDSSSSGSVTAPTTVTHTVVPGDNLWAIAADHLEKVWGRVPSIVEVGNYWDQVCSINQPRLQSGNVSLIYAGEIIELPAL